MSAEFEDEMGRGWTLRLDVPTIRRVRAETKYDLATMFTEQGLATLTSDVCLLVDVLASLCGPQIQEAGLTQEDFGVGLVGDSIEAAVESLVSAGVDFLPRAQRTVNRALWEKVKACSQAMEETLLAKIETIDARMLDGRQPASSGTP